MRGLKLIRNLGPYTLFAFCGVCALLVFTPGCPPGQPCETDADCVDDGVFCNGPEVCVDGQCQSAGDPCAEGETCNEDFDRCDVCDVDADCDDGLFCTGTETCVDGQCVAGTDPCAADEICDEENDACVECLVDADCDDGVFCNGAETCVGNACVAGTAPCAADEFCNEAAGACEPIVCEIDADCDDGQFCNGAETCDVDNNECVPGMAPCTGATPICLEDTDECVACEVDEDCAEGETCIDNVCVAAPACTVDADCDDGNLCTTDTCDVAAGVCVFTPIDCDDGLFCTGEETCDPDTGACVSPGNPCGEGELCDEATDSCQPIGEFLLTEDLDVLVGTANPDTFRGSDATYNTGDFLDGRGGVDRLDLTTVANEPDLVDVLDIERIFVKNTFSGQAIDLSGFSGYEELWYQNGSEDLELGFVGELAAIGFVGGRGAASDFLVLFDNALVDGDADELSIFLDGADGGFLGAGNTAATEGFETITVNCTGNSELESIETPDLQTAIFTGPGNLEVQDVLAGADTIDSTGLEGDLDILCDDEDMTITGGAGNETFRFGLGEFDDDDTVDCGTGDADIIAIRLNDSITQNITVFGCEIFSVQGDDNGVAADFELELEDIEGIQTVRVESLGPAPVPVDTLTLDNIILNTTLMFRGDGEEQDQVFDSVVLDVANSVTSLDIVFNNRDEDLDSDFAMVVNSIDVDTVETVTVNNNDGGDTMIGALDGGDITDLTVVSATDFGIFTALESEEVDEVDGTEVEGTFVVIIANSTQNATMTGGTGPNTLIGGEGEDTILGNDDEDELYGGDGDDDLDGGGEKDLLVGGDGDDNIVGGDEDDILVGGAGADALDGGDGDDEFWYEDENDGAGLAPWVAGDADQVENFDNGDDFVSFSIFFLDNDVPSNRAQGAVNLATDGFIFINNATAASLTDEALVRAAIGAVAGDGGGQQAAFAIRNAAGTQTGIYAYIDNTVADGAVVAGELYLLAIVDEELGIGNLATHDFP